MKTWKALGPEHLNTSAVQEDFIYLRINSLALKSTEAPF